MFVYKRSQVLCCLLFVIFWHDSTLAQHTTNATIAVCVFSRYICFTIEVLLFYVVIRHFCSKILGCNRQCL